MSREIYAGVDLGGTKIALAIFDSDKVLIAKDKVMTDKELSAKELFLQIIHALEELIERNDYSVSELSEVGIGIPGMVNSRKGEISLIAMLPKLNKFPVAEFIESKLPGVRVVIGNDSHSAALAEHRHGAGKGFEHMIYCPVSTGFASGIIIDGKLFTGSDGAAGESGHTIVTPGAGIECGCENTGCICSYASGAMIVRHIKKWIEAGEESIMLEMAGNDPHKITAIHIEEAYKQGDKMAEKALDQMGKYIGIWIFNLYLTLDINCIVFGGGLTKMGDMLFDRVKATFDSYRHTDMPVYFKFAELGQDAGVIGAMELLF